MGALCRIFCAPQLTAEFLSSDLEPFFFNIVEGLRGDVTAAAVLNHATRIVTLELKDSSVLFRYLFPLLHRVLTPLGASLPSASTLSSDVRSPVMRLELKLKAAQQLSTMVCVPFVFAQQLGGRTSGQTSTDLTPSNIATTCLEGLRANWTEQTSQVLFNTLLKLVLVCQCYGKQQTADAIGLGPGKQTAGLDPAGLATKAISAMLPHLTSLVWSERVSLAALHTLRAFSEMCQAIAAYDATVPATVIDAVCRYLEAQITKPKKDHTISLHNMIVTAYHCLINWVLQDHTIVNSPQCLKNVLRVAYLGLTGSPGSSTMQDPVAKAGWWVRKGVPKYLGKQDVFTIKEGPSGRVVEAASLLLMHTTTLMSDPPAPLAFLDEEMALLGPPRPEPTPVTLCQPTATPCQPDAASVNTGATGDPGSGSAPSNGLPATPPTGAAPSNGLPTTPTNTRTTTATTPTNTRNTTTNTTTATSTRTPTTTTTNTTNTSTPRLTSRYFVFDKETLITIIPDTPTPATNDGNGENGQHGGNGTGNSGYSCGKLIVRGQSGRFYYL